MLFSSESLLQLLQHFIKNSIKIKQIHSLLITNGHLHLIPNSPTFNFKSKWKTTMLYNTLIRAYLNIHLPQTTLLLFTHMISTNIPPNAHTFPSIAKAAIGCRTPSIISGPLYGQAVKRGVLADPFVRTSFVSLYAQTGRVSCARKVFDEMPVRSGCVCCARKVLDEMPVKKTGCVCCAHKVFDEMPVKKTGCVSCGRKVFDEMPVKKTGCVSCGRKVFDEMPVRTGGCFSCERKVFDEMPKPCIVSYNAMLDGYCKNGDMGSAVSFFERMPTRDVYSWTSIVNGFDRNGHYEAAIGFFKRMITERRLSGDRYPKPNEATFVSVLSSCANSPIVGLSNGKQIHAYVIKNEDQVTAFIGTALITLYGKTGSLPYALRVFTTTNKKEVCTWNAMIGALASNGKEKEALEMVEKMSLGGWRPNAITFVAILAACARSKLINIAFEVFYSMMPRFGVVRRMEHYGCMVDLLGRAGFLEEAKDFLKKMPFEADATVLGALLGACKLHGDVELGDEVGKKILELQPEKGGQYVTLSSIYAQAERWDRARDVRDVMVDAGVEKPPGYSIVDTM